MVMEQAMAAFECGMIEKEFQFIGISITANFPESFPDAAIKVQKGFVQRKDEIKNAINKEILYSPYMCNEIIATYFACLEVEEIGHVPEGMIGFKLPLMKYAKVRCTAKTIGEAYSQIFEWMQEQGCKQKWYDYSCPIEIYYFEDHAAVEAVDILIPIA